MRRKLTAALTLLCLACGGDGTTERVNVPPGATFAQVTDSLAARRVIGNRRLFTLLARVRGVDRSVRAGVYEFPAGATAWEVLDMLAAGSTMAVRLTIPEGLAVGEVAALVEERLGVPADSLKAAAADSAAAAAIFGFPVPSFEGFLQPETYVVPPDITARGIVTLMANEAKRGWQPGWTPRLDSLRLSRLELVTLASIVEGEARVDQERETIAGVYHNRLRIGMPLQADPTVQYAISLGTGQGKRRLYQKDYQFPSRYNTYLHPGLPPGPVNSPSRRSIEATLYPADVPYLYFVAGQDGQHVFSRTYDEHLRAIARVRRSASGARKP